MELIATTKNSSPEKREDFGEEIPGSRKDLAQRVKQALEDLIIMDEAGIEWSNAQLTAKLREIRRDDIWGSLENRLSELQPLCASPAIALAWRVLYRGIAASAASTDLNPMRIRYHKMTPRDAYVFGLCYESTLKAIADDLEALPLDVTWPEINAFTLSAPQHMNYLNGSMIAGELGRYLGANPQMSPSNAATTWLRDPLHNKPNTLISIARKLGSTVSSPLSRAKREIFDEYAPNWRNEIAPLFTNGHLEFEDRYTSDKFYYKMSNKLASAISGEYPDIKDSTYFDKPNFDLLEEHFGPYDLLAENLYARIAKSEGFDPWVTIKSRKSTRSEDLSAPFESVIKPKIMPATRFENLKRETKSGTPNPRQGNVSEADLIELVPFRGLQYGNWATQAERQEMLNMAYDAMSDLALALGVSPQYLALPVTDKSGLQNLGLALGARGRGGNANAHYEPSGHVINLTKTKGGGSLAHEWMHAYDHKVGSELASRATMASGVPGNEIHDFVKILSQQSRPLRDSPEFAEALAASKMRRLDIMLEVLLHPEIERQLSDLSGTAESWKIFGDAMVDTLTEWASNPSPVWNYACQGRYLKREIAQSNMQTGLIDRGVPQIAAGSLSTLWSERVSGNDWLKLNRRLDRDAGIHVNHTTYLTNAQILNGNKAVGYWSEPTELFARAGSAVVFDRLREIHGVDNGFLDASSDPERFKPGIHKANPNPAGVERERFGRAFSETLLVAMQKEDANATYNQRTELTGTQMRIRF
jgi:hypothetical protein